MSTQPGGVPRFSVVVPAYNAMATLLETLQCIRRQEFPDWECIVVDDGSTDDTPCIVESLRERDPRFVLVRQSNTGTAGAYNAGVHAAKAELIAICSSDDLLLSSHLRVMNELVARNPDYEIYSSNGEYLWHETGVRRTVYSTDEWARERSLSFEEVVNSCFYGVGAVFRRKAHDLAGGYRVDAHAEDYDFWLRAMARGARHLYTPEVLSVYRISAFQKSAGEAALWASYIEVLEHLLETEDLEPEQRDAVLRKIPATRAEGQVAIEGVAHRQLHESAARFRDAVERVVGVRRADAAMRAVHTVSWVVRPIRLHLARRRSGRV